MELLDAIDGDEFSPEEIDELCATPYFFLVCCAYGAEMCSRGGKYHLEVTKNDETMLVATYESTSFD